MGLLSIFKRQADSATSAATDAADPVLRARTRARHRLIGAAVLLLIGVIGFPLVFETQPRPIPVNIPIETPGKDGLPPLAMPAARTSNPPAASAAGAEPAPAPKPAVAPNTSATASRAASAAPMITESADAAGREVPVADSAPASTPASMTAKSTPPVSKPTAKPSGADAKPAPEPTTTKAAPADAARAQALLEGKPAEAADKADKAEGAGRFVVQLGAFAENPAAHELRLKAEKLGLHTYAQTATTPSGKRIRVRMGPYSTRDEADKALAKAKAAGLTAVVQPL